MAVKFFVDRQAFAMEQHLFSLDALRAALVAPAVIANEDGAVRSPHGHVLPPHTVAEAGESLEKWMAGNTADVITCVQVRCVCSALCAVPGCVGCDVPGMLATCSSRRHVEHAVLVCFAQLTAL